LEESALPRRENAKIRDFRGVEELKTAAFILPTLG
jgi:hypothetical protein